MLLGEKERKKEKKTYFEQFIDNIFARIIIIIIKTNYSSLSGVFSIHSARSFVAFRQFSSIIPVSKYDKT